jgi:hypothetical protein
MRAAVFGLAGVMLAACASTAGPANGTAGPANGTAGSGGGTGGSGNGTSGTGAALCAAMSASAYLAGARAVFIGTALGGPAAEASSAGGVLLSPARFHVIRYLKGSGPPVVTVQTALTSQGSVMADGEDGIQPRAGQRWKIYTTSLHMPYLTSICDGSCVLGGPSDDVNLPCGQEEHKN